MFWNSLTKHFFYNNNKKKNEKIKTNKQKTQQQATNSLWATDDNTSLLTGRQYVVCCTNERCKTNPHCLRQFFSLKLSHEGQSDPPKTKTKIHGMGLLQEARCWNNNRNHCFIKMTLPPLSPDLLLRRQTLPPTTPTTTVTKHHSHHHHQSFHVVRP